MADGSIRVETKLDTKGFEKGLEDVDKMCNGTKKHLESLAESLNIKTNPIEIINNSQLAKAKKKLEEVNAEVEKIQAQTDELLPKAETEEQVVNLLKLEEEQTKNLVAEQNNLNKAISEYEAKQEKIAAEKQQKELERQRQAEIKAAEKQQKELERQRQAEIKAAEKQQNADVKSINSDVSGTVAGDDFVSKIKNAEQYEATLEKVKAKMQTIEQKTAKLAAKKGIDGSDALSANREYQKLKKQYDALIASADKFKRSSKGGFDAAADGAKSLGSSMKSAIKTMTKYTLAIFGARSGFYAVKNAIRQVLSDNEELNNTVTAMKGAFANALAPVIERVVYWLKYAFAYLNLFVKVLTGVDMAAQYNAKAINKQTEATKKNAKATKEANAQLAAFDEKNVQSANNQNATDTGAENSAALLNLPDVSGGQFEQICETIKAHINELEMMLAVALLATGFILLAVGQIPMGIACIVAGITLAAAAISGWGGLSTQVQNMITAIMAVAGTAFLVLGIILCASGFKIPVGIAMIAAGAALLIGAAALNWSKLKKIVEENIGAIAAIVAGLVLLVIGMILCCAGVSLPIGIALIAAGAATLVTALALNWEKLSNEVKIVALAITAILSGALIAVGAVVAFCGANLPLGIALMAAGAIGLVTSLTLMWNYLPEKIKGIIQIILGIASAAMLALGIILVATGAGTALGVALIVAGAAGLVSAATLNKDAIVNWISDVWARIKNFWNAHIGYVFKSEWWSKKFDCIKQGMKNALNGVITAIETAVNWIVSKVNILHFDLPDAVAKKVGFSSLGFNLPYVHLPRLAKGGIVNNPGRGQAVIAGEAGAEAILPLQNNTEWMDMLVDKVADRVSMNVVNRITIDGKDVNSSNKKYDSRFAFATNGGVL